MDASTLKLFNKKNKLTKVGKKKLIA